MTKSPFELASLVAQECISLAPVTIMGSGASVACGIPGMPGLRSHFLKVPPLPGGTPADDAAWNEFLEQLKKLDLEAALDQVRLSESLARYIVENTWDFLAPFDLLVFNSAIRNHGIFPLTRLFKHLLNSTRITIDVVTTNYDRIVEYAADVAEICHYTGFSYGHLRMRTRINNVPRIHYGNGPARCVNIWKVHGSFDWFRDQDGTVLALPLMHTRPDGFDPVMVTPGVEKYRLTHDEPFLSIKQGSDSALQSARSFLCVGYGFNDAHIQTKLVERCRTDGVPLVLITKTISDAAHKFLSGGKCKTYLAIEDDPDGSKMYSAEYPDGTVLNGKKVWQMDGFLGMVMP